MKKKRQRIKIEVGDAWSDIANGKIKPEVVRNFVAKHNKHKGGSHKSKKDYDRKSLVQKLKKFIKGL